MLNKNSAFAAVIRMYFRGIAQTMFQQNAWTGLFFAAGIFWGSYECGLPQVAWGMLLGCFVSTLSGYLLKEPVSDGLAGLWGFNGALVGAAFPTFLAQTPGMWAGLVFCAAATTWVRTALNRVMLPWKVNSLTFSFVFCTWVFLLATHVMHGLTSLELPLPRLLEGNFATGPYTFLLLAESWLKGISQVYLINSWVTGLLFLIGLAVGNFWAAFWAALASVIAVAAALLYGAPEAAVAVGLYGFSPVLTGIALGSVFYKTNLRIFFWTVLGIIFTVFLQAGMDALMLPFGIPTLTAPFCIAAWLFLLPLYRFNDKEVSHLIWHRIEEIPGKKTEGSVSSGNGSSDKGA
jgi:urea transporter